MIGHTPTAAPLRVKLARAGDVGHLIRGVGYVSRCTCGWTSPRCETWSLALAEGREHVAEHSPPPAREKVA